MSELYNDDFYRGLQDGSIRSAEAVVPILVEILRPQSVVDVGCGTGSWLAAFARHGVLDYVGIDGHAPVARLEIPHDRFREADLTLPLTLDRSFDLAICLEVAEHLAASAAGQLVESLTRLAPVVVFSAAVPGQGGTGHCNEQWPRYWADLFATCGFTPVDVVRRLIWDDARVEAWYAQNTILYLSQGTVLRGLALPDPVPLASGAPLALIHPRHFAWRTGELAEVTGELAEVLAARASAIAEVQIVTETLAAEQARHRAEVERLEARISRLRFRADPRNMSLRAYVRAMPDVVRGALRRASRRRE